ncbi:hypothetical protein CERZMDRAFT_45747 [Cercospora zeae-maydis SCOH1-5]|uniref:AMP-dependent synthetase/ligase domain-containing protein n=1 Tax=Cercospora zeae-maydis SCOH1-5 TaxID=717836 RepID=A0A6A6FAA6_9PEZI|nr:hypothetical protein CERZMDRAFT_45747 [Cercospora zeae-maydis SCOH1-5]
MPHKSTFPDITLPNTDVFSFFFRRTNREWSDDLVVLKDAVHLDRQYTFKDVEETAVSFGAGIQAALNVQKGDRIAVVSQNDIDTVPIFFGAMSIGAVFSPMNPNYTTGELAVQLRDAEPKVIVTHCTTAEKIRKVCDQIGFPKTHIFVLGLQEGPAVDLRHWKSLCRAIDKRSFRLPKITPREDTALLMYSSGTTGLPKGVMLTHFGIVSNLLQRISCEWGEVRPSGGLGKVKNLPDAPASGDKALLAIPQFHVYGFAYVFLTNLYAGIPVVVMRRFDFNVWCQTIEREKITIAQMVPTMALRLVREKNPHDLSSVRMSAIGGAATPPEIQKALADIYGMPTKLGYGLTEAGPFVTGKRWYDWNADLTAGDPFSPNIEYKILEIQDEGETGAASEKEVAPGETGELHIRSPGQFKGYWKNPQATRDTLSPDGWLRTGDVGWADEQGRFTMTDRAKELIKHKGFQVAPAELEGLLVTHEMVEDVAVVGAWSTDIGSEVPVAFVARKGGLSAVRPHDDTAIIQWLAARVIKYKHLKAIKFLEAIPRNSNGKILRRKLKEMAKKEFNNVIRAKL